MFTRPLRGTLLITSAAAFLAGLAIAWLPMPGAAEAALPRPDLVLEVPDTCPQPPELVWELAVRGYFTAPGTTRLNANRGWLLFQESAKEYQHQMLLATRCAVGVRVSLFAHHGADWPGGQTYPFGIPSDNDLYEETYDAVAYRFPVEPGASNFIGAATGRVQLYPVSALTEAPQRPAMSGMPFPGVLLHETLHTLTGWVQKQGVPVELPPDDVHAAPKLSQYHKRADLEFYQDYLRQEVAVNGTYTGLPPQALLQAGTPTQPEPRERVEPYIEIVIAGTTFYAWSASSSPLTVTYPGLDGAQNAMTRKLGTHTLEGTLPPVNAPVTVCAEVKPHGAFLGRQECRTVPRTTSAIPLPVNTQAGASKHGDRASKRAH